MKKYAFRITDTLNDFIKKIRLFLRVLRKNVIIFDLIFDMVTLERLNADNNEIININSSSNNNSNANNNSNINNKNKKKQRKMKKSTNLKYLDTLKCWYTNATSLCNKWDEFKAIIILEKPHVIMITETWFNSNSLKVIPNYIFFTKDRDGRGGGVAIYVKNDINSCEIDDLTTEMGSE